MARLTRFVFPGQPQHVIVRGNNREPVFASEEDYRFFLDKLSAACEKHQCDVHAYVLMTNHVHILMTPRTEHGIGKVMQMVGRYYVQYFNHHYARTGTLWEGRYKATLIDSERYLFTCQRYIELNPVRAAIVDHPWEYPWSSYHHNALGKEDRCVTPQQLYERLGSSAEERQLAYPRMFDIQISEKVLQDIRDCTNKSWVLGDDRFRDKVESLQSRRAGPAARGGDRKSTEFRQQSTFNGV